MYKDPYPLEMFRRALVGGDSQARQWVQYSYRETVLGWLRSYPGKEEAYRYFDEKYYVSQAFAHLWQAASERQKLEIDTLSTALQYLHASLNGVLLDSLRASSCPAASPGKDIDDCGKVWETLQALVSDARELRLAYLLYHCGLKPKEIVHLFPEEFSEVHEITRLRCRILERLLHNADDLPC